ncbi:hypothetical protein H0I39_12155 [Ottowia beijingensis]|uniref:Uncharacterized protein n=1 Tax=Ottowia beijingensis TaxID=1207057 RepID=A0A853IY75_9BURK|nr:hypothetical protein [Ottowia beijingensis]NZA02318.1 hypothetical protein [Ottowia beijingensis]
MPRRHAPACRTVARQLGGGAGAGGPARPAHAAPAPEFSASLRGEFRYGGQRSIASGDVEGGEFNLDESRDGKTLFAFWSGQLVPAACGAEIRGKWQPLAREGQPVLAESDFILRRARGGTGW